MKTTITLMSMLFAAAALAQEPAVDTSGPAVDTSKYRSSAPAPANSASPSVSTSAPNNSAPGTTIIGERESPIGLYIMPWRNSAPEQGIDRPARLLDEEPLPLDPGTFRRQLDYYTALTNHLKAQGAAQ
ncbi:MAG TPA: hypothetical protein VFB36_04170 [Nevskiaceae bacterium]|nr:hypothetical protein [Nevskiaceae bacterium]